MTKPNNARHDKINVRNYAKRGALLTAWLVARAVQDDQRDQIVWALLPP